MAPEELFVRVVKVETWKDEMRLTNASGFFYEDSGNLFLVTNRHVVINEAAGHQPDSIRLLLHTDRNDLTANEPVTVPLYVNGIRQWREHPIYGSNVDVVTVMINDSEQFRNYYIAAFGPKDILTGQETLPPGQSVLIVGFPLGFVDSVHNLPIIRQAVVASDFAHPFKGEQYFLTDARMHRGTSGAPVVARLKRATEVVGQFEDQWCLLGVHSASLDVSDRDPLQDDRLGLNSAWYARLIAETVNAPIETDTPAFASQTLQPLSIQSSQAADSRLQLAAMTAR